jgi:hypothetical protein
VPVDGSVRCAAAPVTMMLPRLAMQFAPQIIGIYQKAAG